jgi:hypothetical protein
LLFAPTTITISEFQNGKVKFALPMIMGSFASILSFPVAALEARKHNLRGEQMAAGRRCS